MTINATLNIKELIKKRGINQKELAAISGIREAAISKLCRNNADRVDLSHLTRIATALNITDMNELIRLERAE